MLTPKRQSRLQPTLHVNWSGVREPQILSKTHKKLLFLNPPQGGLVLTLPVSGNIWTYCTFLYVGISLPSTNKPSLAPLGLFSNPFSLPLSSPLSSGNSLRFQRKVSRLSSFTIQGLSFGVIFPPASPETHPSSLLMRGFIKRFITLG